VSKTKTICRSSKPECGYLTLPSPAGHTCACPTGVQISAGKCKELPSEYLLFTTKTSIKRISLESDLYADVTLPLDNLTNVVALDYHYGYQMLFYTDVQEGLLIRSHLRGSNVTIVTSTDVRVAEGLAVDWMADNLYWTDTYFNKISVSRLNGSSRKTLINENLMEPRAIALHPALGIMFWTDWGKKGKIEKSTLAGTERQVIVKRSVGWPNGLTIDYENSRVYWVDAKDSNNHIESCNFDGSKRVVVVKKTPHGFSLTALGDSLFWTDWVTPYVHSYQNGENIKIYRGEKQELMDIKVVSARRQQGTNMCSHDNGGCKFLCLMVAPQRRVCRLPDGEKYAADNPYLFPERETTTSEYTEAAPLSTKGVKYTTKEGWEENRTTNVTTTHQYQSEASETSGGGGFDGTRSKAPKEVWKLVLIAGVAFVIVAGSVGLVGYFVVKKRKRSNNAGVYFQNLTYGVNRDQGQQQQQSVRLLQVDQQTEAKPTQSSLAADEPPENVKKDDKSADSESSLLDSKKTMTEGNDLSAEEESEMTSLNTDEDESSKCESSSDNDTNKISSEKDMT